MVDPQEPAGGVSAVYPSFLLIDSFNEFFLQQINIGCLLYAHALLGWREDRHMKAVSGVRAVAQQKQTQVVSMRMRV